MKNEFKTGLKDGDSVVCIRSRDNQFIEGKEYKVHDSGYGDEMLVNTEELYRYALRPKQGGWCCTNTEYHWFRKKESVVKNEFKAGDLVFEVVPNKDIRLVSLACNNSKLYPIKSSAITYTSGGYMFADEVGTPSLFYGTPENRQALVILHGEQAVPKLPLRGSELTKRLLEKQRYVLCYCSDTKDDDCRKYKNLRVVTCFEDGYFYTGRVDDPFVGTWKHAVPVDNNGSEITEIER